MEPRVAAPMAASLPMASTHALGGPAAASHHSQHGHVHHHLHLLAVVLLNMSTLYDTLEKTRGRWYSLRSSYLHGVSMCCSRLLERVTWHHELTDLWCPARFQLLPLRSRR
jgi:hypothetical protein